MFKSVWRSEEPDEYFVVPAVPVQLFPVFLFDLGCDVKSDFLSACVTHFGGDSLVAKLLTPQQGMLPSWANTEMPRAKVILRT
ncbi:hypothetical protein NIES4075_74280 [Tolypothrix sp. NIES-4075]|nr:hypothetical protein NIES4075_74280 [Tolypothrix sp. NIES-4075]